MGDVSANGYREVFPVGELDLDDAPCVLSFGDYEQGVHLSSGVVLRVQGLAHMLGESLESAPRHGAVVFCDAQVFVECAASVGHPLTVKVAVIVRTEARPTA